MNEVERPSFRRKTTMIASTTAKAFETTQEKSLNKSWSKPLAIMTVAAVLLVGSAAVCLVLDRRRAVWESIQSIDEVPYDNNVRRDLKSHDNDHEQRELGLVSISSSSSSFDSKTSQLRLDGGGGAARDDYACFQDGKELKSAVDLYLKSLSSPQSVVALKYGHPIGTWCVGNVTNFDFIFDGWTPFYRPWILNFNQDLSGWNVANAKSMKATFSGASAFNQDLSSWDVSGVENMDSMFYDATAFNSSVSNWNVSRVKSMYGMFSLTTFFRRDLSSWDVSSVENMGDMFLSALRFNSNISVWNVSKVRDMSSMFFGTNLFNQDLSNWDVSSVEKFDDMFNAANGFNQNLCSWGARVQSDATVEFMFSGTACDEQGDPILTATPPGPFCNIC